MNTDRFRALARRFYHSLSLLLGITAVATLVSGCDLLGSSTQNSSCVTHAQGFDDTVAQEGALVGAAEVPQTDPYPMAVIISQDALNQLFAAVAGVDLPDIVLEGSPIVGLPVAVTVSPELPLLQIGGEQGCTTCLVTGVGFGLEFDIAGAKIGGAGDSRFQFPLQTTNNGLESTSYTAQLGQANILDLNIQVNGVDDNILNFFEPLISDAVESFVLNDFGDTHLFDLDAWEVGQGDVKLVGRGPHIDGDSRTIVIGMHTNMARAQSSSIEWDPTLPEGASIGLQLHPNMLHGIVGRMMNEGEIPRNYDETGQASPTGSQAVTLNAFENGENDLLRSNFRLWRTAGGFCGWADLQADMGMRVSDNGFAFQVDNIGVTGSEGAGNLLQFASDWGASDFVESMIDYSEITVNYNEFAIPGDKRANMSAETFQLNLDGRGLSLYLNIESIVEDIVD